MKLSVYSVASILAAAATHQHAHAYNAYNSNSIIGYVVPDGTPDGHYEDTSGWDMGDPNVPDGMPLSWQSLIECFPDRRLDPTTSSNWADNYVNWACNATYGDLWEDGAMLPCGESKDDPVYYILTDIEHNEKGLDGTGYIACYETEESSGTQRNLIFPEGYFAVS